MPVYIANYGMGNLGSIANMIRKVGGEAVITADPELIASADKLVLPGVGAFDEGMRNLKDKVLLEPIKDAASRGCTVLGICLGMQLMLERSEEGVLPGLGLVKGEARRFQSGSGLPRVPHMGWNRIILKRDCPILGRDEDDSRYYFVHSYYVSCTNPDDAAATTIYGVEFLSAFRHRNLFGVQFHPEKSHRFGMALFRRFLAI